jgi:hypothetical protein
MRSLAKFNRMLSYQRRPCPHLFGIGAAMDWSRRLRRRINPAKLSSNRGEILWLNQLRLGPKRLGPERSSRQPPAQCKRATDWRIGSW